MQIFVFLYTESVADDGWHLNHAAKTLERIAQPPIIVKAWETSLANVLPTHFPQLIYSIVDFIAKNVGTHCKGKAQGKTVF
jgi:hypothetical protein